LAGSRLLEHFIKLHTPPAPAGQEGHVEQQKAKQSWEPGSRITLGGREYFVQGREETAPKGLARAYILSTVDQTRQYKWRPFRGLELMNGQKPIRPRRRRPAAKGAKPAAAKPAKMVAKGSLWERLKAHFGRRVKPRRNVTIRRPPGQEIDTQPRP
jgi:hypothetical protein